MMVRTKKVLLVAHCILNQNSVIRDWERAKGGFNQLIDIILQENIGIVQLPCPELLFLGEDRPPRTKKDYDTREYRELCKRLSEPIVQQLKEYDRKGYSLLGLVGIGESPSCDTKNHQGIFMEELLVQLSKIGIEVNLFDVPESYREGYKVDVCHELRSFLRKG